MSGIPSISHSNFQRGDKNLNYDEIKDFINVGPDKNYRIMLDTLRKSTQDKIKSGKMRRKQSERQSMPNEELINLINSTSVA